MREPLLGGGIGSGNAFVVRLLVFGFCNKKKKKKKKNSRATPNGKRFKMLCFLDKMLSIVLT